MVSTSISDKPLMEFIPAASPDYEAPQHLAPLVHLLETCMEEPLRLIVATPPQHGKSITILHALVWLLMRDAQKRNAYVTYATQFARDQVYIASTIAERAGLNLVTDSMDRWRTPVGGGLLATGIGGPLTGYGVDGLLIVDDPLKNRQEAESALIRQRTYDWFTSTAMTRVHPGASVIIVATRWHADDLSGRLIKEGWREIKLPAVTNLNEIEWPDPGSRGKALWPERRPLEWLDVQRKTLGPYDWAALYQAEPRPRGGAVFSGIFHYDEFPQGRGYREGWGADWAYTAKTRADYSYAIQGRAYGNVIYITDVIKQQVEVPQFLAMLQARNATKVTSFMSGTEKAIEQFLRIEGVYVNMLPAGTDKFIRAQPAAAAWNEGRILVPRNAPWLKEFLDEVLNFTGIGDLHDDAIDALAGLFADIGVYATPRRSNSFSFSTL